MEQGKKKVYVGLSGGVDSSVSAVLLKEQGYDVVGVFIKVWHPDFLSCTWQEDRLDAMRVCAKLDIPFHTIDLEEEYKDRVAAYMIEEYRKGRTPNPDVMCNSAVKFGAFYRWAIDHGADFVATGHYAQILVEGEKYSLHRGVDIEKDQSYFLWKIPKEQLKHILFPVGGYTKAEVRILAEKYNLHTASKKDSQGLCFLGQLDMREFLSHYIEEAPGDVLNEAGESIGRHGGAFFYTLGQRHGFNVSKKGSHDAPYYVIGKDIAKNTVTVSDTSPFKESSSQEIVLSECNWFVDPKEYEEKSLEAQIRYRQVPLSAKIVSEQENCTVLLENAERTLSPGQSCVLYSDSECLGGGVI